jgi:hypothetical protein
MKTIELAQSVTSVDELFELADEQNILVRTRNGKVFVIAEVDAGATTDDFAEEVAATRQNQELMDLLAERARDTRQISAAEARKRFGV